MKVVPVQPVGVDIFWKQIEPLIKKAVSYSGGRHTVATTKYLLKTGIMQLFIVFKSVKDIEAVIVTQKAIYPAKTMMTVVLCGGKNMNKWAGMGIKTIMESAKEQGCSGVEVMGRPGWRKIFSKHVKYKESYVCFETYF
jgi:hypothetical protein